MLNVYLAARFSQKDELSKYATELRALGYGVTSRWLEEGVSPTTGLNDVDVEYKTKHSRIDIADIDNADVLVLFSVDPTIPTLRGGRHFESGYAYGTKKHILVVGPYENIFHYLPEVNVVATWEEAKETLEFINSVKHLKKYEVNYAKRQKQDFPQASK